MRVQGNPTQRTVFNGVAENTDSNIAILTVACQLDPGEKDRVRGVIDDVKSTNRDPHLLFNQVGIKLGFIPEVIVRGAFLSLWNRENAAALETIVGAIKRQLELAS